MAKTFSTMMPLGTKAPDFSLPDTVSDEVKSLSDVKGLKGTLIMFICNHCPFVKHLEIQLGELSRYSKDGLGIAAISSNDVTTHPEDAPEKMAEFAQENRFDFPYLFDETQSVARAYGAACTPDFFLFDADLKCYYRGRFDASTPGNGIPVSGAELHFAIGQLLVGEDAPGSQQPSVGCNIKWRQV